MIFQTFEKSNFVSQRRRINPPTENQKNLDLKRDLTTCIGIIIIDMTLLSLTFSELTLTFPLNLGLGVKVYSAILFHSLTS